MSRGRSLAWLSGIVASVALIAAWRTSVDVPELSDFLFWVALLLAADLLPVSLRFDTRVTMSLPIMIAIALLFEPAVAMTMAVLGGFDGRELRGAIPLWRSVFNRSQVILAIGAASWLIHQVPPDSISRFPTGPLMTAAAILLFVGINLGSVALMLHRDRGVGIGEAFGTLLPKPVVGFLLSQGVLGALGVATAAAYREIEFFVAAFLIPLLFARLSLLGARAQQELAEQVQIQQRALLDATEKVFADREQERNLIAENIHDSSMQLLVGAAYAAANSRHYVEEGRLEDARDALDSTKDAIQDAITDLRSSITDLRRSSIEEGGLMETIHTFAEQMRVLWSADIRIEGKTEEEPPIPVSLAAFQILQEGLTNALKHSTVRKVVVRVSEYDGMVHISVEDEGPGFDVSAEPGPQHLGLKLMKERAARVGGRLELQSVPGGGTRLEAVLPGRAAR